MRRRYPLALLSALAALVGTVSQASADQVIINATASGGYFFDGNFTLAGNYAAGHFHGSSPGELRDYFVFDLSSVSGTITSATLRLFQPTTGFSTPDGSETFTLFDVSTSIPTLTSNVGSIPVFNDLGTGTILGSKVLSGSINNTDIDITLDPTGIAYLNANLAPVGIGGAITTISAVPVASERTFNSSSEAMTRQLILEVNPVPEPASALLIGTGALTLLTRRRRSN